MIKKIVEGNLDGKEIVIVDFENFQGVPTDLLDENGVYYLFCGKTTTKKANEYRKMLESYNVFIIETTRSGPNFVDNRISMYIGYIFGKYEPKKITLVSNDIDYFEMVADLLKHGYPIVWREPSMSCADLTKRQKEYIFGQSGQKATRKSKTAAADITSQNLEKEAELAEYIEKVEQLKKKLENTLKRMEEFEKKQRKGEIIDGERKKEIVERSRVERIIKLNGGDPVMPLSKIKYYLRCDVDEMLGTIQRDYATLVEKKGAERVYKLEC